VRRSSRRLNRTRTQGILPVFSTWQAQDKFYLYLISRYVTCVNIEVCRWKEIRPPKHEYKRICHVRHTWVPMNQPVYPRCHHSVDCRQHVAGFNGGFARLSLRRIKRSGNIHSNLDTQNFKISSFYDFTLFFSINIHLLQIHLIHSPYWLSNYCCLSTVATVESSVCTEASIHTLMAEGHQFLVQDIQHGQASSTYIPYNLSGSENVYSLYNGRHL
jgi:hypothetical protein